MIFSQSMVGGCSVKKSRGKRFFYQSIYSCVSLCKLCLTKIHLFFILFEKNMFFTKCQYNVGFVPATFILPWNARFVHVTLVLILNLVFNSNCRSNIWQHLLFDIGH